MTKPGPRRFSLTVQYACDNDALPSRPLLREWVRAALDSDADTIALTLRLVDEEEGRRLNREYRGKDKHHATNVLAFPYESRPNLAGDLVLCVPVVLRQAAEQGKPAVAHFAHLVVHGMLRSEEHTSELQSQR